MKFTIDRLRWFRGEMADDEGTVLASSLYVETVKRSCCLGLIAREMGISAKRLDDIGSPESIPGRIPSEYREKFLDKCSWKGDVGRVLKWTNNNLSDDAMSLNDNELISDKMREHKLKQLFKKHGHEITFIN